MLLLFTVWHVWKGMHARGELCQKRAGYLALQVLLEEGRNSHFELDIPTYY